MFLGHSALAFAITAYVFSRHRDYSSHRAISLGLIAGAFAVLPDIDSLYAIVAIISQTPTTTDAFVTTFWSSLDGIHRSGTHSFITSALVIGASLCTFEANSPRKHFYRRVFLSLVTILTSSIITITYATDGVVLATVLIMYIASGILLTTAIRNRVSVSATDLAVVSSIGLFTHPIGDIFTGKLPAILYPLSDMMGPRIVLTTQPTMNFLLVFLIEVGVLGLAVLVYGRLTKTPIRTHTSPLASTGIITAVALVLGHPELVQPPTIDHAYQFVYPTVGVALVVAAIAFFGVDSRKEGIARAGTTGIIALAGTGVAYAVGYLIL